MLFNSLQFVIFFIVVTFLYFLIAHRFRWILLLVASCYFYMSFVPIYVLILFFTIVIDYFAGIYIEKAQGQKRKILLATSLVANIGVLAIFKYYNFFNENLSSFFGLFSLSNPVPYLDIILPIGLSFHTFQAMSYTIEVYRGEQRAEKHFGLYSLYVMFYPQLVAGPIERPQNVLHQFREVHHFDSQRAIDGLKLMAWGMFKKVVIADRLAVLVNQVYDTPEKYTGLPLLIATFFFAFQIYCDFSGYSDIALGSARVMGFKLISNFNAPYFSTSIAEFWRKWHISLSTWFRDYLYIPLGGNRVKLSRKCFNLFFVFLISGFWHGANWTFIVWGGLHGMYLAIALLAKNIPGPSLSIKLPATVSTAFNIAITFSLVCISWVFFRAANMNDAIYILSHMGDNLLHTMQHLPSFREDWFKDWLGFSGITNFGKKDLLLSFLFILILLMADGLNSKVNLFSFLKKQHVAFRFAVYSLLTLLILVFGEYSNQGQFIYFQF